MDENMMNKAPDLSVVSQVDSFFRNDTNHCRFNSAVIVGLDSLNLTSAASVDNVSEAEEVSVDDNAEYGSAREESFSEFQFLASTFECGVCAGDCSYDELFGLFLCDHKICNDCAVRHFENQIKNFSLDNVVCPYPNCTDLSKKDDSERQQYFAHLQVQLKDILHSDTVTLLEQKLLNLSLSEVEDFIWCPNCENGMISSNPGDDYVMCLGCHKPICPRCKQVWTPDHQNLTCEEYKTWKYNNDPVKQEQGLKVFLEKYGMECPNPKCKAQFVKSSGGCLHMSCPLCNHQFCEGCLQPFVHGEECQESEQCAKLGLHAHHPRNCFYFLRDWTPNQLQRLLDSNVVKYETKPFHENTTCPVFEQKELSSGGYVDEECNCDVLPEHAGLCSKHYVQYLGRLVLKHKLDPLPEYPTEDLEKLCTKHQLTLPPRDRNYHQQMLRNLLQLGLESVANKTILDDPTVRYEESDDEEEVGAVGGWCAPDFTDQWSCAFCTYLNEMDATICEVCNRTKTVGEEGVDLWLEEGQQCIRCTLINPIDVSCCQACEEPLRIVATPL